MAYKYDNNDAVSGTDFYLTSSDDEAPHEEVGDDYESDIQHPVENDWNYRFICRAILQLEGHVHCLTISIKLVSSLICNISIPLTLLYLPQVLSYFVSSKISYDT